MTHTTLLTHATLLSKRNTGKTSRTVQPPLAGGSELYILSLSRDLCIFPGPIVKSRDVPCPGLHSTACYFVFPPCQCMVLVI